ncbi:MAG: hypothetical protein AB7H77_06285 [Bdellovibrionales bacterium]
MNKSIPGIFAAALMGLFCTATPALGASLNETASTADQMSPSFIPANEPHFTKVIEDLPLMPGLQLIEDEDVLFASANGRIAETNAIGPVDVDQVYTFYRKSLPSLGWKIVDARTYIRESEQLRIDARASQKITVVKFTVKPAG